jgi:hypothetical protein
VERIDPTLVTVGATAIVSPNRSLPPEVFGDYLALVLADPDCSEYGRWMRQLEERLGVNDAMRRAATQGSATVRAELSETKRRRVLEESMRASRIHAKPRDEKLAAKITKMEAQLEQARAEAADPQGKTDRDRRRAGKQAKARVGSLLAELAKLRIEESDQDRLYGDAAEPILLAKARGAEVVAIEAKTAEFARDEHGARILNPVRRRLPNGKRETFMEPQLVYSTGLRAKNLTGPEQALASDLLNDGPLPALVLLRIANDYRDAYLIGEGEISSGGEGGGGFGPKAPQPRRAEASQDLADMRRRLGDLQRKVLDLVCGKDMRCCEAARQVGLGDYRTAARVLRVGLKAARDGQWAARDARRANGDAGALSARIQAGNAMLATVRA